jgi:hypothetical protein
MPNKAAATTASCGKQKKTRKGPPARAELRTPAIVTQPSTAAKRAWARAG